ncbi:hypothetical protein [Moraxella bovis]|uniref:hypothetical protein n=1 Tax=Moraxella bovis TaxID=476 RepID=UPI00227AA669|nr:hypothetical protein [Moraxella bovis]WAJ74549.1 hypothetical protein LP095_05205 [Moraxella bovis]WAJ74802.1 hypothetical protein LP095_06565 [Moraxella bovis]
MKPKQSNNGVSPIIDALLMRMSELDRFSDDERVIANKELLLLDVVCVECKDGTKVFDFVTTMHRNDKDKKWYVFNAVDIRSFDELDDIEGNILRTIHETEGAAAREMLMQYFGGGR